MRRVPSQELLDDDLGTPEEIQQSFDDLWRINRWLGGVSGCLHLLDLYFSRCGPGHARILDVGAGDSRLAAHLQIELARRNRRVDFLALDRRLSHLQNGNGNSSNLLRVVADITALPFAEGSVDVVICNLFLHHFSEDKAVELLQRLAGVAAHAVLVNDLERHVLPYFFIQVAWPFARSRLTRHDGAASVRQAYTKSELARLACRAGYNSFEVVRLPAFRLGLALWKD